MGLLGGEVGGGGICFWGGGVDWKKVMLGKCAIGLFELLEPLNVLLLWNLNFS